MYRLLRERLTDLRKSGKTDVFSGSRIGVEKESLRVNSEGSIAQTPHPQVLGSALTHPFITTDYSEALTEFITPPLRTIDEALTFLRDIQQFVYSKLENEILWATSMPCVVRGETSIPIAEYGTSNPGMMKKIYRIGLGYRYGRGMQVIAGVHFNYSFAQSFWDFFYKREQSTLSEQDFRSEYYFAVLRNLQRLGWMVPYLFGSSPAVCKSFLQGQDTGLSSFDENTFYEPFATSLRMGDIGYQNNKENETGIKVNYNSLSEYIDSLVCAINTPCEEYAKIGVKVDGEYRQLNANLLQIENEYYSTVRPKQLPRRDEKPTTALRYRGVQYIELRSLDVNAFDPIGINEEQLRFIETLMFFCALHSSPPLDEEDKADIDYNEMQAAHRGRDPQLKLRRDGGEVLLSEWAKEVLQEMLPIAELLDKAYESGDEYMQSVKQQFARVENPDLTPSARMLAEMREHGEAFFHFARRMSLKHQRYFQSLPSNQARADMFATLALESIHKQKKMEAEDKVSFDEYLAEYLSRV